MDITLADQYYLKAKDAYPYSMNEVLENLNYALSYDDIHPQANCLMGMVQMFQLKNYVKAAESFDMSLMHDGAYIETIKHYALLKIWTGDHRGANKLITYGLKVPGMDTSVLYYFLGIQQEINGNLRSAKQLYRQAVIMSTDSYKSSFYESQIIRVKGKKKLRKKLLNNSCK